MVLFFFIAVVWVTDRSSGRLAVKKQIRAIMFGPPGAGKGTQSKLISDWLSVPHISTGAILRREMADATEMGKLAQEFVSKGELVPDNVLIEMMKSSLDSDRCPQGWILDGFPRTLAQARFLDVLLAELSQKLDIVLFLDVSSDLVVERLLKRAELEGRADDNEDTIRNRLSVYENQTLPVLRFYDEKDVLIKIDGGRSLDEVTRDVKQVFEKAAHL